MFKEPEHIDKLIEGCGKDDRKAQEELYRSFYSSMMVLCLRYTKNEADAKAVLNGGFFKVFRNIQKYNPQKATLYTWIRTIMINACIDYIKSKDDIIIAGELNKVEALHIEPEASAKMKAEEILQLIRELPSATRAVFNLFTLEGYGHKEISGILKISEGTSKWHLSEARKILKMQIQRRTQSE
ncbi:MAG TPA: RNA polymerase sigma factor [Chitinophagaceae bacterium]|nr:RNA polymerase sigma factor [Chitinophagaceae bacterium]